MRRFTVIAIALGIIFIFQNCATSEYELTVPEGVLLDQSQLEQLFKTECTFYFKNSIGQSGTLTCYPDGTQELIVDEHPDFALYGTYKIENGQKCNKWDDPRVPLKCWKYYKIGEKKYRFVSHDGIVAKVNFK